MFGEEFLALLIFLNGIHPLFPRSVAVFGEGRSSSLLKRDLTSPSPDLGEAHEVAIFGEGRSSPSHF